MCLAIVTGSLTLFSLLILPYLIAARSARNSLSGGCQVNYELISRLNKFNSLRNGPIIWGTLPSKPFLVYEYIMLKFIITSLPLLILYTFLAHSVKKKNPSTPIVPKQRRIDNENKAARGHRRKKISASSRNATQQFTYIYVHIPRV